MMRRSRRPSYRGPFLTLEEAYIIRFILIVRDFEKVTPYLHALAPSMYVQCRLVGGIN